MADVYVYRVTKGNTAGWVSWTECEGYEGPDQWIDNKIPSITFEARSGTVTAPAGSTIEIIAISANDCTGPLVFLTTTTTTTTSTTTTSTSTTSTSTTSTSTSSTSTSTTTTIAPSCNFNGGSAILNNTTTTTSTSTTTSSTTSTSSTTTSTSSTTTTEAPTTSTTTTTTQSPTTTTTTTTTEAPTTTTTTTTEAPTTTTTTTTEAPTTTTTTSTSTSSTSTSTSSTTSTTTQLLGTVYVTNSSLDIPITGVYINGVAVTFDSGVDFPIPAGDSGNFTTNQLGTYDIQVFYGGHISGQNIVIVDSASASTCCNLNGGSGTCTFVGASIDSVTAVSVIASDGSCF